MNYLAHIFLSFNQDEITIGNFMADSVRGKRYLDYPVGIQKGILLHRQIDTYTDAHPTVRQSTKRLHKNYSHYSSVIVDILYDHFLAKNWNDYSEIPLHIYAAQFYTLIQKNYDMLPGRTQYIVPHMVKGNWLLNYAHIDGIQSVLEGMNRRTKFRSGMNMAVNELKEFYTEFEQEFTSFFADLIAFSSHKLQEIESNYKHDQND